MTRGRSPRRFAAACMALALLAPGGSFAADAGSAAATQEQTQATQEQALAEREKKLVADAVAALVATTKALAALEQKDTDTALAQLEVATGKLDLLVSRHPTAALLPVDVVIERVDVLATPAQVRAIAKAAEEALEDGEVQRARHMLEPLASELVITTTELPLALYPDAIRLVAPLIEAGQ